MKRESFIFYSSWLDAINVLPAKKQGELLAAIIVYGLRGELPQHPNSLTQAILAMVKPQIDSNNLRYENGRKGAVFGQLGGRPPEKPDDSKNPGGVMTENPSGVKDETPNVYDYVNVDDKDKESTDVDKKEATASSPAPNLDYIKFKDWIKQKAPYCANPKNFPASQITEAEFLKLKKLFTGQQIAEVIEQIENRKDLRKRYSNLYRTVLNWAKKQYGK